MLFNYSKIQFNIQSKFQQKFNIQSFNLKLKSGFLSKSNEMLSYLNIHVKNI